MRINKFRYFLAFLGICLVFVLADSRGLFNPVRPIVQFITAPATQMAFLVKTGVSDNLSFITFWRSGEARIKNLEQKNAELTIKTSKLGALERENKELKKQLGVNFLGGYKRLPASVLGVSRYMTINKGRKEGVREGQTVVYMDNLVGQVKRVDDHVSFVQLITDVESKILVKIGAEGIVKGVAMGQFNSAIVLDQVAQNEAIKEDEVILSSGEEGRLVPDLILGRVSKITSRQTDLFKRAEIEPLMKLGSVRTVFVLLP